MLATRSVTLIGTEGDWIQKAAAIYRAAGAGEKRSSCVGGLEQKARVGVSAAHLRLAAQELKWSAFFQSRVRSRFHPRGDKYGAVDRLSAQKS